MIYRIVFAVSFIINGFLTLFAFGNAYLYQYNVYINGERISAADPEAVRLWMMFGAINAMFGLVLPLIIDVIERHNKRKNKAVSNV